MNTNIRLRDRAVYTKAVESIPKNTVFGLDLLRVAATFMVFLFHINMHLGFSTSFAPLDTTISVGANFMVCFFMLSGFLLSSQYIGSDLLGTVDGIKSFFKKRLLRLYPAYLFYLLIVFLIRYSFPPTTTQLAALIPVEFLVLQAFFPASFSYLGNGGTWFISVTIFLYFLFPLLIRVVQAYINTSAKIWKALLLCYALSIYVGMLQIYLGGDSAVYYYTSPIFRIPEFMIGILLGQLQVKHPVALKCKRKSVFVCSSLGLCLGIGVLFCIVVSACYGANFMGMTFKSNYLSYNFISALTFALLILILSKLDAEMVSPFIAAPIHLLSKLSLYFYLTQGLAIKYSRVWIAKGFLGILIDGDKKILLLSLLINLFFSALMYLIVEKMIARAINKLLS